MYGHTRVYRVKKSTAPPYLLCYFVRAGVCTADEHRDGLWEEEGAELARESEAGRQLTRELDVVGKPTEQLEGHLLEALHLVARGGRGS
jgi:hypothetical protein